MIIYWDGVHKNMIGPQVKKLRKAKKLTQKNMAAQLQVLGYEFNDLTILRIEQQTRFVSDFELKALAYFFHTDMKDLFPPDMPDKS